MEQLPIGARAERSRAPLQGGAPVDGADHVDHQAAGATVTVPQPQILHDLRPTGGIARGQQPVQLSASLIAWGGILLCRRVHRLTLATAAAPGRLRGGRDPATTPQHRSPFTCYGRAVWPARKTGESSASARRSKL